MMILHIELEVELVLSSYKDAPGHLPREVFWACWTERRPWGKTQDTVEGLCLSADQRMPWSPSRKEEVAVERDVWTSLLNLLLPLRHSSEISGRWSLNLFQRILLAMTCMLIIFAFPKAFTSLF